MFQSPVTSSQSPPASEMARRTRRAHSCNGLIQVWRWIMADRKLLGLSATLVLLGGVLLSVLTRFVHPGGGPTEEATFAINAASEAWTAIHVGQFVAWAVLLAGLLVLCFAL